MVEETFRLRINITAGAPLQGGPSTKDEDTKKPFQITAGATILKWCPVNRHTSQKATQEKSG